MARIALVNDERWIAPSERSPYIQNILDEDAQLERAFRVAGASTERVAWSDPDFDGSAFDALLIRQTWDYFERYDEFMAWLDRIDGTVRVVNPIDVIRWNADKRYLVDLDEAGIASVPTRVVARGETAHSLADRMQDANWSEVVIKPAVSGAGRETYRVAERDAVEQEGLWQRLVASEDMLIQPFVPAILDSGEVSLVVVAGEATHAVRKIAAPGEFRVQDDHGGTVHPYEPSDGERAIAERAIGAATERTGAEIAYARVDLVESSGGPQVMELELIEPELFFRNHPPAADALARAVLTHD